FCFPRALNLAGRLGITSFGTLANLPSVPCELVPVSLSTLVDHWFPFPSLSAFLGRPPSLPHSFMRFLNSRAPHAFFLASALRLPKALAASLMPGLDCFFMASNYKPNVRICNVNLTKAQRKVTSCSQFVS